MSLAISPETTVGALLAAYPQVESALVEMAPAFAMLRNPVVRRTVAKVAALEQAAKIGGVSLQAMILKLRHVVGQSVAEPPVFQPWPRVGEDASWLMDTRVVEEIDSDAMLEAVGALAPGDVVILRSSFRPQPLIETMRRAGAAVHSSTQGATHVTWFGKQIK